MKRQYILPQCEVYRLKTDGVILTDSWNQDDTGGISDTPGGQSDFNSKDNDEFGW